jgi:HAE1 family hydrophobic/amphiphilic exporter-1
MQWLANICVRRPVFALVMMLTLGVVGAFGYFKLGVDAFPKLDFPVAVITTHLDGAAPEEVETEVTDKIEEAVNTVSGIDELRSQSYEGVSVVIVTFVLDREADAAVQDVRDHIQQALGTLPKGIDPPVVSKVDPDAAPILYLALKAPGNLREVTEYADKSIRRRLESINGVGGVSLVGGRKRQINVLLDTQALRANGVSAADVERAIASQNLASPGGTVETGPSDLTLRVQGRVESPAELGRIVVRQSAGHALRVQDVARVEDSQEEEQTAALEDGHPTLVLSIRKQSGENTVAVVEAIRYRLATLNKDLPPGYKLEVVRDASGTITTEVNAVKEHLVVGALLAALVVLVFLGNFRSTIIAALAIPVSIIGTFALMAAMDFTLNIITLLALALAVGIVIDDAIVVLENIFRFIHDKKMKPFPAAIAATQDIGLAVLATTLSLMAVFLPIAFMNGIIGRFLRSFGLTMGFAIAVSLFVSFTLTPMLAARWIDPVPEDGTVKTSILEHAVAFFYKPIERLYVTVLAFVMRHRWLVVLASMVTMGSCIPLGKAVPKGFLPDNDEAQFEINIRAPEGTSLQSTMIIAERIAREVRRLPGVEHTLTTIGDNDSKTPNLAKVYVHLVDPKDRVESQAELVDRTRREIVAKQPKDLRIDVSIVAAISAGGQSTKLVQYSVTGPDLTQLGKYSEGIVTALRAAPGAADVDSDFITGQPEVRVHVLRDRAADLGVQVADITNTLQLLVGGLKISTYEENGEDYDVRIRADRLDRSQIAKLNMMTVPSARLGTVSLRDVVSLRTGTGPSQINRLNRQRVVTIASNVLPGFGQSQVQTAMESAIAAQHMPPAYAAHAAGQTRETGRTAVAFLVSFGLSFIFMYLILAAQFESWLYPISIMVTLPLTVPFALVSLLIFGQGLNIQSALGLLVLFGVVKKNAILQVDHTNHLRREGMARGPAILQANKDRLRPILMTTIAFVAGMLPLIFSKGIGAGFSRATAGIVVGGQTLSLALTLLATPVLYSYLDDLSAWFARVSRRKHPIDRGRDLLDNIPHTNAEAVPVSQQVGHGAHQP